MSITKEDLDKLFETLSDKQIEYIYHLAKKLFGQTTN